MYRSNEIPPSNNFLILFLKLHTAYTENVPIIRKKTRRIAKYAVRIEITAIKYDFPLERQCNVLIPSADTWIKNSVARI